MDLGDMTHSIAHPRIPISFPFTYIVYLLPFLSFLAGSKSVSARSSDANMMATTALDIASSSGKECNVMCKNVIYSCVFRLFFFLLLDEAVAFGVIFVIVFVRR